MIISFLLVIVALVFFLKKDDGIIFLYIVMLSTNEIFSHEIDILGVVGTKDFINLLVFVHLIRKYPLRLRNDKVPLLSSRLVFLLLLYFSYNLFKSHFLNIYDDEFFFELSFVDALKKSILYVLRFFPLILIINSNNLNYNKYIIPAIYTSAFVIIISCLLTEYLLRIGFMTYNKDKAYFEAPRNSGFFAGDANSLGTFLNLCIFFLLSSLVFKRNLIRLIILLSLIGGLFLTYSRMAAGTLVLGISLIVYYNRDNDNQKKRFVLLFTLIVTLLIVVAFLPQTEILIRRFSSIGNEVDFENERSRTFRWFLYLDNIFSSFASIIRGNDKIIYVWGRDAYPVDVHNFFIKIFFNAGLLFLIPFLFLFYKLAKYTGKINKSNKIFFIIATISMVFISTITYIWVLVLFINYLYRYQKSNKVKFVTTG